MTSFGCDTRQAFPSSSLLHRLNHRSPSIEYRAWVDGEEAYVFNQTGLAGGTMSWIYLDLHPAARIRVQPHRLVDEVRVLPRRHSITAELEENTATFSIETPGTYQLEWDQNLELPFFIFARPPAGRRSEKTQGRLIEFGPGEHRPGRIELKSGDELYLAPGAEVYGAIYAKDASHFLITGRGTLRQSHLPFEGKGDERHPLELINCEDVIIDGPMFLEGCTWNIVFRNCDRIQIRNVTVVSEGPYSTDGINPCDSRNVLVENCFIRCKDDCISVKGLQRQVPTQELKPIHNIEVRNCVFWSDNNNGLVVGTETWASEIRDVRFQGIDFIRVAGTCGDWAAAFSVQALADTHIHDILFEDIEVEYCSGNPFSILFLASVYGIPGERRDSGGLIESITFRNITFHQKPKRRSLIQGKDELRTVKNIDFEKVSLGGSPILSAENLRLQTNTFASSIRFS